ncbi:hypothetical protein AX15_007293 [Amanita polypyramis BW_CC]|nr:hypothetical protein AX15_007293 [Amanita polypyramis BW_CC]
MSQHFSLFNLDKRQYLAKSGKVPELVCSGVPPGLVTLLLRPSKSGASDGLGAWAGHRLVCAGDYMKEYPTNMLSTAEEVEVRNYGEGKGDETFSDFYHFARDTYAQTPVPSADAKRFKERQVWVLRNISKHVYVRGDVLAGRPEATGPYMEPFGFGDLLLANITWSTNDVKMDYGHVLVLGPWAGDRFDIVPWEVAKKDIKKDKKSQPWKDVSEEQAGRTRLLLADLF